MSADATVLGFEPDTEPTAVQRQQLEERLGLSRSRARQPRSLLERLEERDEYRLGRLLVRDPAGRRLVVAALLAVAGAELLLAVALLVTR